MDWISIKEKPKEFSKVIMKCTDGKERWGVYDPESWVTPWIFEDECCEPFKFPGITHWKYI